MLTVAYGENTLRRENVYKRNKFLTEYRVSSPLMAQDKCKLFYGPIIFQKKKKKLSNKLHHILCKKTLEILTVAYGENTLRRENVYKRNKFLTEYRTLDAPVQKQAMKILISTENGYGESSNRN